MLYLFAVQACAGITSGRPYGRQPRERWDPEARGLHYFLCHLSSSSHSVPAGGAFLVTSSYGQSFSP